MRDPTWAERRAALIMVDSLQNETGSPLLRSCSWTFLRVNVAKTTLTWEELGLTPEDVVAFTAKYQRDMIDQFRRDVLECRRGNITKHNGRILRTYLQEGFVTLADIDPLLTQEEVERFYQESLLLKD